MTSVSISLSPLLTEALGHMQRYIVCPEEVRSRIAGLRVPIEEASGSRISSSWRTNGGGRHHGHHHHQGGVASGGSNSGFRPPAPTFTARQNAPKFGNRARQDATVEERMMDRIRGKMNKFSELTYNDTKAWLCQLLDSGETDFLTDFIKLVFEKAAMENTVYCELYARLITEILSQFPHLGVELQRIFSEFVTIFAEVRDSPDITSAEYKAYVEMRERQKFRRGYANFIAEIARLRVISMAEIMSVCDTLINGILHVRKEEGQHLLCEEYTDCLLVIVRACANLLKKSAAQAILPRIKEGMDRTGAPSLSNKVRFCLMDIADLFA